jgi:hypothetical protein
MKEEFSRAIVRWGEHLIEKRIISIPSPKK